MNAPSVQATFCLILLIFAFGIMIMGGEARHVVWWPCTSDSDCQGPCSTPVYHCINGRCVCN
uniref:Uncharacterized protein n=1 Tax=Daucus carota subsp. sativus TaxID=79200 RepID=A0A166IPU2_DAUCS